jgi:hypothetical protein
MWQEKRDSQFFVLGSKDESGGCQGCVMTHVGGNRFPLPLRLNGKDKRYIRLDVSFAYGLDHVLAALKNKQAMSYRFLLDDKGWRVFVSTAVLPTPTCSDVRLGAIGVDFNVGFVSVSDSSISTSQKRKRSCRTRRPADSVCCRRLPTRASRRQSALARTIAELKSSKSARRTVQKSVLRSMLAGTA